MRSPMVTELDDEITGKLLRLDAYQTLQPQPAILQFNGRLIERCDGNVRDVEVLGLISVETKLGRLKRTFPTVLLENHEMDTRWTVLTTRWMNECLGSFYDEKLKKFFTISEPSWAVSFEWESCPRPQKIELVEEPQTQLVDWKDGDDKPMVGCHLNESRVVAPENARKEVSELVYHEGAGSGTEMNGIGIGESAMVDYVTERVDTKFSESSVRKTSVKE